MKKLLFVFTTCSLLSLLLVACGGGQASETVVTPSPTATRSGRSPHNTPPPPTSRLPTPTPPPRGAMNLDGNPFDWKAGDILFVDQEGDSRHDGFDISTVFALAGDEYLYLMIETWWPRKDYEHLELEIEAAERRFLVSFRPKEGGPAMLAEFADGEWVEMGEVADSLVVEKLAVELQIPLAAIGGEGSLQLTNVRPMGDEQCGDNCTAVDETEPVQMAPAE